MGSKLRYASIHEIAAEKANVIVATDALESHTQEVIVSLQDALRHRVAGRVTDALCALDVTHQRVADTDWCRDSRLLGCEVHDLDMAAEADNLIADGVLES